MALPAILGGIGLGLGGLGSLANLFKKSPEEYQKEMQKEQWKRDDAKRAAQLAHLQGVGPFQQTDYQFDPSQHGDVLEPMQEQADKTMQGARQSAGLAGQSGGQLTERLLGAGRRSDKDYRQTVAGLARQGEEKSYGRDMDAYQRQLQLAMAKASV